MVSTFKSMKVSGRVKPGVLLLVSLLVLAACGTSAPTATPTPTPTVAPPQAAVETEATSLPEPTTVPEQAAEEVESASTPERESALEPPAALAVAQQAAAGPGKIGFVSSRDGNPEIYVMNVDGTNQTRLTYDPAEDAGPT